jgi:hypothetical protein
MKPITARARLLVALVGFLLPVTARSDDAPTFIGSTVNTETALAKSDAVFIGKIMKIGVVVEAAPDESSYFGTVVEVSKVFKGTVDNQITVALHRHFPEQALKAGDSYIFFAQKNSDGGFTDLKLLPANQVNNLAVKLALVGQGT